MRCLSLCLSRVRWVGVCTWQLDVSDLDHVPGPEAEGAHHPVRHEQVVLGRTEVPVPAVVVHRAVASTHKQQQVWSGPPPLLQCWGRGLSR